MNISYRLARSIRSDSAVSKEFSVCRFSFAVAIGFLIALVGQSAQAANDIWSTSGTTVNWNLAGNWSGGIPTTGSILEFGADSSVGTAASDILNNDITAGLSLGGIIFDSGDPAYTFNGNSITLTGGITDNGTNLETINLAIATTAVQTITMTAGGGNITLGGNITGTNGGITTAGAGTLTLSGTNGYTGVTTIAAGTTLQIGNGTSTGSLGTGTITDNGALNFALTSSPTISKVISGSGSLTLLSTNTGTVTLTSATPGTVGNTYSGGTTVNGGVLTLGSGGGGPAGIILGALTINSGATVNANYNWSLGWGTGKNVTAITINGGTLAFNTPSDGGLSPASITMTGGTISGPGTMDWYSGGTSGTYTPVTLFTNASSTTAIISTGLAPRLKSNALTMNVAQGTTPSGIDLLISGAIVFNGDETGNANNGSIIKSGAGTAEFTGANTYIGSTVINAGTLQIDFSASGAPTTNIINNTANSSSLTLGGGTLNVKYNAGNVASTQRFNGTAFTANTSSAVVVQQNSNTSASTAVTLGALTRNTGSAVDFTLPTAGLGISTSSTTFVANSILTSAASNGIAFATVNGGTTWATNTAGTLGALGSYSTGNGNYTSTNNMDVTGGDSVSGVTVNTLRFNAASETLTLAGANTVSTGGILITPTGTNAIIGGAGTLQAGGGNELVVINDSGTAATINSAVINNSTASALTLAGSAILTNNATAYTGGTSLLTSASSLTYNMSGSYSYSGAIGGAGSVTQAGTGSTVTLRGTNTYTGGTTLQQGVLAFGNNALGTGPLSFTGGTLKYVAGNTQDVSARIAAGTNTGPIAVDLDGNNVTWATAFGGSGGLTLSDSGPATTLILSGADTYSGTTTVSGGTLQLSASTGSLNASSPLTFSGSGGTFSFVSAATGSSQTLGALTFGGGPGTVQSTWGTSGNTVLTFASLGARTQGVGATGNFLVTNGTNGATNKIVLTTAPTAGTLIDPGIFFGGGATGAGYATYDSGGFLRAYISSDVNALSQAASSSGIGGSPTSSSNVFIGGTVTGQTTAAVNALIFPSTLYNLTLNASQILTVNGILKTGNVAGGAITATGGAGGAGGIQPSASSDLIIRTDQGTDSLTLTSNILANGTNTLIKSGAGTLTMTSGYANNMTGGLFLNSGTYAASTDAALGATGGAITFNGGTLWTNASSFTVGATRPITVNTGGAGLEIGVFNSFASGSATIASTISGVGGLSISNPANSNGPSLTLSGNNSFSGGIFNNVTSNTLTLNGANAGGTGNVTYLQGSNNTNNTVNLRSDTSATFSVASVNFSTTENYTNSFATINVGPITSGITGQTITLNSVSSPHDQGNNSGSDFVFSSASGSGYTLAITTLNMASNDAANVPITANTNVAIGTLNWTDQFDNNILTLAGSVGGSVATAINNGGASLGGINVTSGTWTFTGANSYGAGPWTNNGVQNAGTAGTQINGASTTLAINNDLALGTVPTNATANNIGLVAGGTLKASASFTLNSKRGIGIGGKSGSANDTGTIDVASGQTLTYNGIIASSGTTGTVNLTTTPSGGTLILGGPNTYNGVTALSAGTLLLNSSTLTTGTGAVNVSGTGTLGGTGTIKGQVTLSGTANAL